MTSHTYNVKGVEERQQVVHARGHDSHAGRRHQRLHVLHFYVAEAVEVLINRRRLDAIQYAVTTAVELEYEVELARRGGGSQLSRRHTAQHSVNVADTKLQFDASTIHNLPQVRPTYHVYER
jgi:hypothetical protein